jgi:hypothetical protein
LVLFVLLKEKVINIIGNEIYVGGYYARNKKNGDTSDSEDIKKCDGVYSLQ